MVGLKDQSMVNSHYKSLTNNKSDVKFIETLVGKKIGTIKTLLEEESDLDLLLNYNSSFKIKRVPKNISRKLFAKYLIMHFIKNEKLTYEDKSYLAKIISFYWQKNKISDLEKKVFHSTIPTDEQSARIHFALFTYKRNTYGEITQLSNQDTIKKMSKSFMRNPKTRNIGENLVEILKEIRVLRRDSLFDKFITKC